MVDLLHLGASSLSCRQHVVQFLQHSSNASVNVVMKLNVFQAPHFTLVKEALIEIGCVVTSLVGWLVVTRVHCGHTVHPRPIVTMEH